MRKPWSPLPSEKSDFPPGVRAGWLHSVLASVLSCGFAGSPGHWHGEQFRGGAGRGWARLRWEGDPAGKARPSGRRMLCAAGSRASDPDALVLPQAWFPFIRSPSSSQLLEQACLALSPSSASRPAGLLSRPPVVTPNPARGKQNL